MHLPRERMCVRACVCVGVHDLYTVGVGCKDAFIYICIYTYMRLYTKMFSGFLKYKYNIGRDK